jgi:hypothetical protein
MKLDTHQLDKAIAAGEAGVLLGQPVDWHGQTGEVVLIARGTVAIKARVLCSSCRRRRSTVYAVSGCHSGAFCYLSDPKTGQHLADLRNQTVLCQTCAGGPRKGPGRKA